VTRLLLIAWGMGLPAGPPPVGPPGPVPAAPADVPPPAAFALTRWEIGGDPLFDRRQAERALPWAPGDSLPEDGPAQAAEALRRRAVEGGWWGARVDAAREDGVVTLTVDAGEPVITGDVEVYGNTLLTREEILSRLDTRAGRPFDDSVFRADVARVLRAYSERAHPLARVYPSDFRRLPEGTLGFQLRIGEGPEGEIEFVRVFGNTSTEDAVVARIGGVRPGDRWNVRRLEGMAPRLRREGLFESVTEPRVVRGSRDNRLGIELEVQEGPSNALFGVLGYNPKPGGGGEVVGQVDVRFRNILGTARRASFRFERQAREVRDLQFRYREPWLLGTPISVEVGAAQALRDTLYSRTDLDLGVAVPFGDRSTARIAAERRSSSFEDAQGVDVEEVSTGGSVSLEHDARDRPVNPGRGWYGRTLVGARRTETDVLRSRLEVDAQRLFALGRTWVVSEEAGFRGVESTEGVPPLADQYYLGGTNSLRGYREEQFHGERVWWIRSELRYRLSVRSRAYAFADAGGYRFRGRDGAPGASDVLAGGGVGVSLETRGQGIVRFELALGRGDGFSDAKVHVGLDQEF
jgi:outer membrane protein insertion porin family